MNEIGSNLKYLCADKPSTAVVCREIGINQQQFSKYLSGRAKPSPHNLRRIANYFGISETAILGTREQLVEAYTARSAALLGRQNDPLNRSFPGDIEKLRPYLGAYQIFFKAPIEPNGVVSNTIFLDERNGEVYSRLIEALPEKGSRRRRWTRCDGRVSFQNGRLFVVDSERRNEHALGMQILAQPPRQQKRYLFGSMCYLASFPTRMPYTSKVVWKKFDAYKSVRELFETSGVYSMDSRKLDPKVRSFFNTSPEDINWL
ncbi:MAG: helix-turn-helix transcriptional regulator [Pseudomonadota bacterium]